MTFKQEETTTMPVIKEQKEQMELPSKKEKKELQGAHRHRQHRYQEHYYATRFANDSKIIINFRSKVDLDSFMEEEKYGEEDVFLTRKE